MGIPVNRLGFTRLDNGKGRGGYRVNIIFVHGLKGHPKNTWGTDDVEITAPTNRGLSKLFQSSRMKTANATAPKKQPFWPGQFLPDDFPTARVWTYGYNADVLDGVFRSGNKNGILDHGRALANRFEREIRNNDPVIFVAHSLGGIVVKNAVYVSKLCRAHTKTIIFLGTPHRGSKCAGWGGTAANLMASISAGDPNKKLLNALKVDSPILDFIQEEFKAIALHNGIKIVSFQEAQGLLDKGGIPVKVVEDFSSYIGLPQLEQVKSIDADHRQMVRCNGKNDERYLVITGALKQSLRF